MDEHLEGPHPIWLGCGQFEVYRDTSRDVKFYVLSFHEGMSNQNQNGYQHDCSIWYKYFALKYCSGVFGPGVGLYEPVCEQDDSNLTLTGWIRYPNDCIARLFDFSSYENKKEKVSCDEPSVPTVAPVANFYHVPYGYGAYGGMENGYGK